jgi:two-component SAPR family response regulator
VQIGDVEITKGWNLRKAKSLFLYLLFHRSATREELINLFWPNLEISKAKNQLRVSINSLKSLLNQVEGNTFIHGDREHLFLSGEIQCDGLVYIKELEEACKESDLDIRFKLAERILGIRPKKLLVHIYDDWYLDIRESIETQYCELCGWVANHLRSKGLGKEALKYDKKAAQMIDLG